MNIMRKFLSSSSSVTSPTGEEPQPLGGAEGGGSGPAPVSEPDLLGLSHLRKLYAEYANPSHPLSDAEKEEKIYNMLPLFIKV